jgi:hypothetical protein
LSDELQDLNVEDFKDSCIIFDDVDVLKDKKVRNIVYTLLDLCLETGRHHNITVIITNHLACDGKNTKRILNECKTITFYPLAGINRQLKYMIENYIGFDKKEIQKLKNGTSRAVTVFREYPQFVLTENEIYPVGQE